MKKPKKEFASLRVPVEVHELADKLRERQDLRFYESRVEGSVSPQGKATLSAIVKTGLELLKKKMDEEDGV